MKKQIFTALSCVAALLVLFTTACVRTAPSGQTGASSVQMMNVPLDSVVEWRVKVRTAELEVRTARAEAKAEAYDNLIANGWSKCCDCDVDKNETVVYRSSGTRDLTPKQGYTAPQGPVQPSNFWDGFPGWPNITASPNISPTFNNSNGCCGEGNGEKRQQQPEYPEPVEYGNDDNPPPTREEPPAEPEKSRFTPSYTVNVIPFSEAGMASGGLRWNLTDKFALDAGLVSGYRRIPQTTSELIHGFDVRTGTHIFVGAEVGATYQLTDKFSAFGKAAAWGRESDDFAFTIGGAWQAMKNVNVGLGFTASKEMTGLSLILKN